MKSETLGTYLNIIKATYSKPIANIKINEEKFKVSSLKSRTRFASLFSVCMFDTLARLIRQPKETKEIQIGKDDVKASLFTDGTLIYISDHKNSTRNFLQLINSFSHVHGYKDLTLDTGWKARTSLGIPET